MIAIWGNNKQDGQCRNTLRQLEKLKTKNGWKMEMCQKQTRWPFLKNGCFSVIFTSFLAPFFIPFFWKMKSKMRSKIDQKWELWTPLLSHHPLHPSFQNFQWCDDIWISPLYSGAPLLLFLWASFLFVMLGPHIIDERRSECGKITQTLYLNRCYIVVSKTTRYWQILLILQWDLCILWVFRYSGNWQRIHFKLGILLPFGGSYVLYPMSQLHMRKYPIMHNDSAFEYKETINIIGPA